MSDLKPFRLRVMERMLRVSCSAPAAVAATSRGSGMCMCVWVCVCMPSVCLYSSHTSGGAWFMYLTVTMWRGWRGRMDVEGGRRGVIFGNRGGNMIVVKCSCRWLNDQQHLEKWVSVSFMNGENPTCAVLHSEWFVQARHGGVNGSFSTDLPDVFFFKACLCKLSSYSHSYCQNPRQFKWTFEKCINIFLDISLYLDGH